MTPPLAVSDRPVPSGVIRTLRMDRPAARNAMDTSLLAAFVDALEDADADPTVRGVLIAGGESVFSAGADVREQVEDGGTRRSDLFIHLYARLSTFRLPTAAAVEGAAVGGGAEVAAACDVRVAGHSALFRFPGAIYGIPIGAARTVGLVGLGTAKDWVLSSRDVPAEEAHRAGFVQVLCEDGAAEAHASTWLELVASRDPATVELMKRTLADFSGLGDRVAWENDALRAFQEASGILPRLDRNPARRPG